MNAAQQQSLVVDVGMLSFSGSQPYRWSAVCFYLGFQGSTAMTDAQPGNLCTTVALPVSTVWYTTVTSGMEGLSRSLSLSVCLSTLHVRFTRADGRRPTKGRLTLLFFNTIPT